MSLQNKIWEKLFKFILSLLAVLSLSNVVVPTTALVYAESQDMSSGSLSEEDVNQLIPLFEAIENIPQEMLERGDSKEIESFFINQGVTVNITEESNEIQLLQKEEDGTRGAGMCALHLGQLLLMVAIPVSKISKIKDYISALGGVTQTAKLLVGATSVTEKMKAAFTGLSNILLTITGINGIREHCLGHNV